MQNNKSLKKGRKQINAACRTTKTESNRENNITKGKPESNVENNIINKCFK